MKKITVTVEIPSGDSCHAVKEGHVQFCVCTFYRSKGCALFGRVIHDKKKCRECLAT